MLPADRITAYRESLKPKLSAEEVEAQKQFQSEVMMQIHADRDAKQKARTERLKQQITKDKARRGY